MLSIANKPFMLKVENKAFMLSVAIKHLMLSVGGLNVVLLNVVEPLSDGSTTYKTLK